VNFTVAVTAAVTTVDTMGATISTEQALAADILDPTTQAAIAADITEAAVMVVVAMAAAVTAVAAVTTNWHYQKSYSEEHI